MARQKPEPVQAVKQRRDTALNALVQSVPYVKFLGISFDRRGDELTGVLTYSDKIIGNPMLPAIHGGVTASFLETVAIIELAWSGLWADLESGALDLAGLEQGRVPPMPKTIDITVDYLRSGLPRDAYARAQVNRSGRRYASVEVEAWQDNRSRLFARASGHFLMPQKPSGD